MMQEHVRTAVDEGLRALFDLDGPLLECDAAERTIVARLAYHLSRLFPEHNVDVEYNRHGLDPKRVAMSGGIHSERTLVIPDIVVHQRGTDDHNLVVVEVKKATNSSERDHDRAKIEAIKREHRYQLGLLLILPSGPGWACRSPVLVWM